MNSLAHSDIPCTFIAEAHVMLFNLKFLLTSLFLSSINGARSITTEGKISTMFLIGLGIIKLIRCAVQSANRCVWSWLKSAGSRDRAPVWPPCQLRSCSNPLQADRWLPHTTRNKNIKTTTHTGAEAHRQLHESYGTSAQSPLSQDPFASGPRGS